MAPYENYAFEELRAQDYAQGNRGTSTPTSSNTAPSSFGFGSPPSAAPVGGFGAPGGGAGPSLFSSTPAPAPGGMYSKNSDVVLKL